MSGAGARFHARIFASAAFLAASFNPSAAHVAGGGLEISGRANGPLGYTEFCRRTPGACQPSGSGDHTALTPAAWQELQMTNLLVNRSIEPVTDKELYGVDEFWTLPQRYGDCEDYVLLKRKLLMEKGWSSGSLLIAVVFDEVGAGHAVLIAQTSKGDLVLDNKVDEIRPWDQTPYRYVKEQSVLDPNEWMSVGDPRWSAPVTAAPH